MCRVSSRGNVNIVIFITLITSLSSQHHHKCTLRNQHLQQVQTNQGISGDTNYMADDCEEVGVVVVVVGGGGTGGGGGGGDLSV